MNEVQQRMQQAREQAALAQARQQGRPVVYIDTDGCEVTATTTGHVLYNAADWW